MNGLSDSRVAGIMRTVIAAMALLLFWSAIGYGFWPELAPRLMGLLRWAQPLRAIGAEEVESQYFDVRNNSSASDRQVQRMVERLEQDYVTLAAFLGREPEEPVSVLLTDGSAPAYAERSTLYVFSDHGVVGLETAPFFLAYVIAGPPSSSLFFDLGLSLYAVEETGLAEGLTGQPADAWVVLLQQKEALIPLEEAWSVEMAEDEEGLFDFFRAMVEGGSFVRWLIERYGWDVVWEVRGGGDLEAATGVPLGQAEADWLVAVAAQDLRPKPCLLAIPGHPVFRGICQRLEDVQRQMDR
jgi:hypothetical protein